MSMHSSTLRFLSATLDCTKEVLNDLHLILSISEDKRRHIESVDFMRNNIFILFGQILTFFEKVQKYEKKSFIQDLITSLKLIMNGSSSIEYSIQIIKEIRTTIHVQIQIKCEHQYSIYPNQPIQTNRIKCWYCDKCI